VRPGYARNFLIPQQLVVYSTHENKSLLLQEKSSAEVIPQHPTATHRPLRGTSASSPLLD
jgi:ribosomal protein L9